MRNGVKGSMTACDTSGSSTHFQEANLRARRIDLMTAERLEDDCNRLGNMNRNATKVAPD
jgi:hypothetical protein